MKKRKLKSYDNLIYIIIIIIVILMLILGREGKEEIEGVEETIEESTGSGFLEIETFPSNAEIFVDAIYKGKSPTTLYNIPVGSHEVIIKKEEYEDFVSKVNIEGGKKTFLETRLALKTVGEKEVKVIEIVEEEISEEVKEETLVEAPKANVINIGSKFLLYYDFSEGEFADIRNFEEDAFSKRYDKHLVFTRLGLVDIKTIDKNIYDVEKGDCISIRGQFEYLNSGQSLCVITKEGMIAAIGGSWDDTENAELIWKLFD